MATIPARIVTTTWPRDCWSARPNTVAGALGVTATIPYQNRSPSDSTRWRCGAAPGFGDAMLDSLMRWGRPPPDGSAAKVRHRGNFAFQQSGCSIVLCCTAAEL